MTTDIDSINLHNELAPQLAVAIRKLDYDTIKLFLKHDFEQNFKMQPNGINMFAMLMAKAVSQKERSKAKMKNYIRILKLFKFWKPDFLAQDKFGRTCFHMAASAGNSIAL